MSLLIKALEIAEKAQAENAKANEAKAQNANTEQTQAQTKAAKNTPPEKTEVLPSDGLTTKRPNKSVANASNSTSSNIATELSLSPPDSVFSTSSLPNNSQQVASVKSDNSVSPSSAKPPPTAPARPATQQAHNITLTAQSAKSAANVFSAKGVESSNVNTRLALIAGAGLIALLAMGLYFYQFVDSAPDVFIAPRSLDQITVVPQTNNNDIAPLPLEAEASVPVAVEPAEELGDFLAEPMQVAQRQEAPFKKAAKKLDSMEDEGLSAEETPIISENSEDFTDSAMSAKVTKKTRQSKNNATIASDSASIQVSKSNPQAGINPTLMGAYEAYNAGNDKDAIKLYKQVLQRDVRNTDALLGLGAIASRQGRMDDANGWYSKVLEVDPRNNIALAAMLDRNLQSNQSLGNEQGNETRLKNMLAKNPDDANLHVALGNLYAEQNQWPAAQQAYFDAYSLNKTADNAFNLAVSLDQMGKPKLALPYYQRALDQANASSNIDKAALEARIAAIQ